MKSIKWLKVNFISLLILYLLSPFLWLNIVPDANATDGAFPLVKHGGGTTDGETPYDIGNGPGVDRSVNPSYSTHYNDQSSEAGKYKGGECTHCHEPHASFGGSEAPPGSGGDAGPDDYLAFKEYGTSANFAELCWYCHENFSNINGSGSPPGMGRWNFYQGSTVYQNSSHYTLPNGMYWPGDGSGSPIWPRKDRFSLPSGNNGSCLNCHTPHGIKSDGSGTAFDKTSEDGSGGVPASLQTVASGNPSANADYLIPRQLIAWEETLCERCHDGSPASTDIQDEINKRLVANQSGHPVDDTTLAGRHVASESLPVTQKHVECYDCHNPHAANANNRLEGMKYVNINGTVQDPALGARQPYVYEVCLKCHGTNHNTFIPDKSPTGVPEPATQNPTLRTTVSQYGCATTNPASECTDGSDKELEFDTNTDSYAGVAAITLSGNRAYHPVAAAGRNTSTALANQLLGNLITSSTINCNDCHNNNVTGAGTFSGQTASPTYPGPVNQSNLRASDVDNSYSFASPVGPHGSTNVRILRANYNTSLGTTSAAPFTSFDAANFALCFNCHDVRAFTDSDGIVDSLQMTNFRMSSGMCISKRNLHALHLGDVSGGMGGWDELSNMFTACANCHYNVHSNAEATNTIYGDGAGGSLPPDGDTHLINFSPIVEELDEDKPRWWYAGGSTMRCNMTCHGVDMGSGGGMGGGVDAWYTYYGS